MVTHVVVSGCNSAGAIYKHALQIPELVLQNTWLLSICQN